METNTRGLVDLRLTVPSRPELGALVVNSGSPGAQSLRAAVNSFSGSLEPIPEAGYSVGPYDPAGTLPDGTPDWDARFPGPQAGALGPFWRRIDFLPGTPLPPPPRVRGDLGFHLDANREFSPGSAGCVVFRTLEDLKTFHAWGLDRPVARLYVNYGLGSVVVPGISPITAPVDVAPSSLESRLDLYVRKQGGLEAANRRFAKLAIEAGQKNDVDPLILTAIAAHETNFGQLGVGVDGLLGVGAFDLDPNNAIRNPQFAGVRNQLFVGAATFRNLRNEFQVGSSAPVQEQLFAANRRRTDGSSGWASDLNWHKGVFSHYRRVADELKLSDAKAKKEVQRFRVFGGLREEGWRESAKLNGDDATIFSIGRTKSQKRLTVKLGDEAISPDEIVSVTIEVVVQKTKDK